MGWALHGTNSNATGPKYADMKNEQVNRVRFPTCPSVIDRGWASITQTDEIY